MAWAMARLGCLNAAWFEGMSRVILKRWDSLNVRDAASLSWAAAAGGCYPTPLVPRLLEDFDWLQGVRLPPEAGKQTPNGDSARHACLEQCLHRGELAQAFQLHLAVQLECRLLCKGLPTPVALLCREAFNEERAYAEMTTIMLQSKPTSTFHREVSESLDAVSMYHSNGVVLPEALTVDVVLQGSQWTSADGVQLNRASSAVKPLSFDMMRQQNKVCVEVSGPSHFLLRGRLTAADPDTFDRPPRKLAGSTRLKHRMLSRLGWYIVVIPFFHWDSLLGSREKADYVKDLLASHQESLWRRVWEGRVQPSQWKW